VLFVRERFGRLCCRETIRSALHRLDLSWKKAKKLLGRANPERRQAFMAQLGDLLDGATRQKHCLVLGRANPERRQAFMAQLGDLLDGATRQKHCLVYLDEAHIHQDADLGYGWAERGQRLWVASSSPSLSARGSFYGLDLYNEGQVQLWPYGRANGEHTIDVLRRLRAEVPERKLIVLWDGAPYHRAHAVREVARTLGIELVPLPGYSPDLMPVEALWRWLREDVTYHHCHASAEDLTRRVAAFEVRINQDRCALAERLQVTDTLDPDEEKLRFSS
jgi:transposase